VRYQQADKMAESKWLNFLVVSHKALVPWPGQVINRAAPWLLNKMTKLLLCSCSLRNHSFNGKSKILRYKSLSSHAHKMCCIQHNLEIKVYKKHQQNIWLSEFPGISNWQNEHLALSQMAHSAHTILRWEHFCTWKVVNKTYKGHFNHNSQAAVIYFCKLKCLIIGYWDKTNSI